MRLKPFRVAGYSSPGRPFGGDKRAQRVTALGSPWDDQRSRAEDRTAEAEEGLIHDGSPTHHGRYTVHR
jgi:hypothetical protein